MKAHDLASSLCPFASNETVFRAPTQQFWNAAQGNGPSADYVAADISVPSPSRDNDFK